MSNINPIHRETPVGISNQEVADPFAMDIRQFRSTAEGPLVNEATPTTTITIIGIGVAATASLLKVASVIAAC